MIRLKFYGLGGQGVVTAAKAVSYTHLEEGEG